MYDFSYALEMAHKNQELRLWINIENADEEMSRAKGKGKKKGNGKEKGEDAICARAEGRSGGKGMEGSVTANHPRFRNVLGLGNDEIQFILAMRKYKDETLLESRAAEMESWRNAS